MALRTKKSSWHIMKPAVTSHRKFYCSGFGRFQYDGLLTGQHRGIIPATETDAFLALAPADRVLNELTHTWQFKPGPGARYYKDASWAYLILEFGFIVSSRVFLRFDRYGFLSQITPTFLDRMQTRSSRTDAGINYQRCRTNLRPA